MKKEKYMRKLYDISKHKDKTNTSKHKCIGCSQITLGNDKKELCLLCSYHDVRHWIWMLANGKATINKKGWIETK